ncbi:MAG: ATP-dependent zinc metalloprotease FtsH [Bdellovibrionales bacterium]
MKSAQKTFAIWIFLLLGVVFFGQQYSLNSQEAIKNFTYPMFIKALQDKKIKEDSVVFYTVQGEIGGELKPEFKDEFKGLKFKFAGDIGDEGAKELKKMGIIPSYNNQDSTMWAAVFFNLLPLIIIIGLFVFFMKQLQAGGGKALSFGKSKAKLLNENTKKVTFKNVAGVEEAKEDLEEIVHFLKDPKRFTKLGGRIPKGVLLVGPPGTGKTLLARAVAGEAGVPFFSISGSDFVEMFVGVGASRVRDMFDQGKRNSPCIIFIDEIDAVGRHRGAGMGGGHDEREQTLNQLLVEMDGFEGNSGIIIIAATNRADVLDPALLRPGRFDRRIMVGKPDLNGRFEILKVHTKKTPLASDVDLKKIARGTPGFSGADLENLINEAALWAARNSKNLIDAHDLETAKDKVLMGSERRSMIISDEDKKITAYHEAGHTLVGQILPGLDPVHKVSIMPRGRALGITMTLPEKDSVSLSKSKIINELAVLYGGRAAEEIIFNDITTGASNDIERASDIARKMVTEWGMSDKLGPLAYGQGSGPVFQGLQQQGSQVTYSDTKALQIDEEVDSIIKTAHETAVKILKDHSEKLEIITQALLQFETIDGAEVSILVKGGTLEDIEKRRDESEQKLSSENLVQENKRKIEEQLLEEQKAAAMEAPKDPTESPA